MKGRPRSWVPFIFRHFSYCWCFGRVANPAKAPSPEVGNLGQSPIRGRSWRVFQALLPMVKLGFSPSPFPATFALTSGPAGSSTAVSLSFSSYSRANVHFGCGSPGKGLLPRCSRPFLQSCPGGFWLCSGFPLPPWANKESPSRFLCLWHVPQGLFSLAFLSARGPLRCHLVTKKGPRGPLTLFGCRSTYRLFCSSTRTTSRHCSLLADFFFATRQKRRVVFAVPNLLPPASDSDLGSHLKLPGPALGSPLYIPSTFYSCHPSFYWAGRLFSLQPPAPSVYGHSYERALSSPGDPPYPASPSIRPFSHCLRRGIPSFPFFCCEAVSTSSVFTPRTSTGLFGIFPYVCPGFLGLLFFFSFLWTLATAPSVTILDIIEVSFSFFGAVTASWIGASAGYSCEFFFPVPGLVPYFP